MQPLLRSTIPGTISLHRLNIPLRLAPIRASQSASVISCTSPLMLTPALLTRMSGTPMSFIIFSQPARTEAGSETSKRHSQVFLPSTPIRDSVLSAAVLSLLKFIIMSQPSLARARAQAAPIPRLAPLISASISASRATECSCSTRRTRPQEPVPFPRSAAADPMPPDNPCPQGLLRAL